MRQLKEKHIVKVAYPARLYIDGSWAGSASDATFVVEDPATGVEVAAVADATPEDGVAALDAACAVRDSWQSTPPRVRGEILRRVFEALTARTEEFARIITLEAGKPIIESRSEVAYAAEFLRWFAEEAVRVGGRTAISPDGKSRLWVERRAVGPCLLITPWNFPLAMATRKIAPAVAAGCPMVVKPAELTPLSTLLLAELFIDAGLPNGVLNIVPTSDPSALTRRLLSDPRLRKVSFTGSTPVGRTLLQLASTHVIRTSMELGGNAPFIVFADACVDAAVAGAVQAKLRNGGQACTAANRFLVHESVVDEFSAKFAAHMDQLRLGPGVDPRTDIGPLINQRAVDKVAGLVEDAVDESGARVLTRGQSSDRSGYFFRPTVLADVPVTAGVLDHEIFGPVAPISSFSSDEEALRYANDTEYGLAAYVYTSDLDRAMTMSESIEVGMVAVNTGLISNPAAPFGGIKQSGLGREGGAEGIAEYLDIRYASFPATRFNGRSQQAG
ncbi:NAD-dependent succinate-semialdehyde dehydrogenase [Mycobacterium sp. NPDC050441]|uniref:NAD-dependent succinate-semialdehyde dehydrogenase n=1 Tax=Mycobacterium sp. NPDC050441 TaxID=3155403 RepID=UPI00340D998E